MVEIAGSGKGAMRASIVLQLTAALESGGAGVQSISENAVSGL